MSYFTVRLVQKNVNKTVKVMFPSPVVYIYIDTDL